MTNTEIPENLKRLYKHWHLHTISETGLNHREVCQDENLFKEVVWFVEERINIWKNKTNGIAPPFTKDEILSAYKFCNIFMEFDRQTIEFHELLNPLRDDFPLWLLNMFYCRMVARPETINAANLLSFDEKENEMVYKKLMNIPRPRFGNAYVFPVSVIQRSQTPTRELFLTKYLPAVIPRVTKEIESWNEMSVYDGLARIIPIFGYNLYFLWTEILIDVAYQFPEHIDLFGRFPIGPGAMPTLNKMDAEKDPSFLVQKLSTLPMDVGITFNGKPIRLSAENWEGICCEFRKYTNLREGRGRKRFYR